MFWIHGFLLGYGPYRHLDKILKKIEREYKVFAVEDGEVTERKEMAE